MVGEQVRHPKYGLGVVKGQKHRGLDLYVAFEGGRRRWVRATDIESVSPARPPRSGEQRPMVVGAGRGSGRAPGGGAVRPVHARDVVTHGTGREGVVPEWTPFYSRRVVEALRMGIVPDDCVARLTVGRDEEIASLRHWLERGEGSAVVVGEYGSGKSHLLRYLALQALEQGYAVASVQLDPNETPLHKPKRIYKSVAASLQYRPGDSSRALGFRDLLRAHSVQEALGDHRYFRELGNGYATEEQYEELFWEWIEAREDASRPEDWLRDPYGYRYNRFAHVPPIYPHTTAANIICYLLSGVAWATHGLGLRGLVVLLDEAESMDVGGSWSQVERGRNLLRGLVRMAYDDERLLDAPLRSGLVHSGMGIGPQIPFLYRKGCGLRFVFGFTPTPLLDQLAELSSAHRIDLRPLGRDALTTLFEWVYEHYSWAYDREVGSHMRQRLLDTVLRRAENTRAFAKGCVEALDSQRRDRR